MGTINKKPEHVADVVIFGAGIAGLWTLRALKERGYNVLLLDNDAIGAGQTIASQGIIHSGLKYALGGKILPLAKTISEMPERWKEVLKDDCTAAPSQALLIPKGFVGNIVKMAAQKALSARENERLPENMRQSGFDGSVVTMDEPVLDVPKVLEQLSLPYKNCIRKISDFKFINDNAVECDGNSISAKAFVFTAAGSNHDIAKKLGHDKNLETRSRPLLMGLLKNAPFPLYAHLVGKSDKPVATITTHKTKDGSLVWYVGGGVAERLKNSPPDETYDAIKKAFAKYLPAVDLSKTEWAVLPIDRFEGASGPLMPDTPTIHNCGNAWYAWPTKLTFAPLLADMLAQRLQNVEPSKTQTDWALLPEAQIAETPWNKAQWKKHS